MDAGKMRRSFVLDPSIFRSKKTCFETRRRSSEGKTEIDPRDPRKDQERELDSPFPGRGSVLPFLARPQSHEGIHRRSFRSVRRFDRSPQRIPASPGSPPSIALFLLHDKKYFRRGIGSSPPGRDPHVDLRLGRIFVRVRLGVLRRATRIPHVLFLDRAWRTRRSDPYRKRGTASKRNRPWSRIVEGHERNTRARPHLRTSPTCTKRRRTETSSD